MQLVQKKKWDADVERRILEKQIDLLYGNQVFAIFITIAMVAIASFYISVTIGWAPLQNSLMMFVIAMLLRIVLSRWYWSAKKNQCIKLKHAEIYYLIGVVVTGFFWCVVTLSLFPLVDLKGQILLLVLIVGFGTGAQTTMGYLKAPVSCFLLLLFLPLIYVIYHSGFPKEGDIAIAVTVALYFLFLLRSSLMFYKNTYEMLHLQEISIDREREFNFQKEKANSANQAKSEFLSRMSHELRTPLNAILGFSELQLRDRTLPLSVKQSLRAQKIGDAGKHLLSIVNDVLDFSRIETGSIEINLEVINLSGAVLTSLRLVEEKATLRNISISVKQEQLNISVMADENKLKQIIVNLLDNAIKFNRLGGNISVYANISKNNRVRLYVSDTGFGLQDGDINELFVPFSRLGADSLGIDGTGIGLSLCKELVELMDGNIGVDDCSDEGCLFWIELPHVANKNNLVDNKYSGKLALNIEKEMKVLLVEDNLVNSEVAADMLAMINIHVDAASNGLQAIDLFKINRYSLILMDCEMPVMDGFATTKEIRIIEKLRQHQQQERIPIIALTAHAISGAKDECIASGMDDFLSKPFSMDELHSILYKWLEIDKHNIDDARAASHDVDSDGSSLDDSRLIDTFKCDTTILDHDILSKLFNRKTANNVNLLSKLVSIYLEQSSKLFFDLKMAYKKHDVETIRTISHTLKSSSVNVGALKLSALCRDVELACQRGNLQESEIESLYRGYSETEDELICLMDSVR